MCKTWLPPRVSCFYVVSPIQGLSGPLPGEEPALHAFDLKERKDHVLLEGADQYALSFDGKKILYAAPKSGPQEAESEEGGGGPHMYGIVDAKVPSRRRGRQERRRQKARWRRLATALLSSTT